MSGSFENKHRKTFQKTSIFEGVLMKFGLVEISLRILSEKGGGIRGEEAFIISGQNVSSSIYVLDNANFSLYLCSL